MNRVAQDEVRGDIGLVPQSLDPFRPIMIAMILAAVVGLMVLILLLSQGAPSARRATICLPQR